MKILIEIRETKITYDTKNHECKIDGSLFPKELTLIAKIVDEAKTVSKESGLD